MAEIVSVGRDKSVEYLIVTFPPDEEIEAAWNECLDNSEYASHFTSPAFLSERYPPESEPFAILAMEGGEISGVVTGVVHDRRILCGEPGSPHLCIRRNTTESEVIRALLSGLREHAGRRIKFISIYCWNEFPQIQRAGFRRRRFSAPLGTILLDLSKGANALFREFSETRRNKIRRAIRAKVDVREMDMAAEFDEYYSIYVDWCSFKNMPCQPYAIQRAILEANGNRLILVARHDGVMIGVSTFRYRRPGIVEYAANVSRRSETRFRQNDLLIWRAIEWFAALPDVRWFSTAAAHYFLQKLGGELHSTYRYSKDRSFFKRHHLVEASQEALIAVYQLMPSGLRGWLKSNLRHQGDPEQ